MSRPRPRIILPDIDPARCTGCGWCVAACPPHVLSLEPTGWTKKSVLHDPAGCTGCAKCAVRCPFDAITMRKAGGLGAEAPADGR
jgi:ferredoxin